MVNSPEKFAGLTGAEVLTQREALHVDPQTRTVLARNLETGEEERHGYDELIITVGASPVVPPLEGVNLKNVFHMRTAGRRGGRAPMPSSRRAPAAPWSWAAVSSDWSWPRISRRRV